LSVGLSGSLNESTASNSDGPVYHGVLSDLVTMLSPLNAEAGMNFVSSTLNPTVLINFSTSALIALNFS